MVNDEVQAAIDEHVEDRHYDISKEEVGGLINTLQTLEQDRSADHGLLLQMSSAIQGEPDKDLGGHIIGYQGGMQNDIRELKHLANGGGPGGRVRTSSKLGTALITTGMIGVVQIVVALIGRI